MSIIVLLHIFLLTFTFGHVELLTVDYHSIDTPIVELNNHTLREVFESGNLIGFSSKNVIEDTSPSKSDKSYVYNFNLYNVMGNKFYYRQKANGFVNTNLDFVHQYINKDNVVEEQQYHSNITSPFNNVLIKGQFTSIYENIWFYPRSYTEEMNIYFSELYLVNQTSFGISSLTLEQMDTYYNMYQDNIGADDVTYDQNEMTMTDLIYILGFGFVWFVIGWSIRKVVL